MSGHPRDTSAAGRGRLWIAACSFVVVVIALYAVYFCALYLIVSVIS